MFTKDRKVQIIQAAVKFAELGHSHSIKHHIKMPYQPVRPVRLFGPVKPDRPWKHPGQSSLLGKLDHLGRSSLLGQ